METTTTQAIRSLAAGALLRELELRVGSEVAVRVVAAPPQGGQGAISLAGQLLRAQLPPGLVPNQKLAVQVARGEANEVVLKVLHEPQHERGEVARTAGALAVSGDPKLVQVADALQQPNLALPLPNGDALTLRVLPDPEQDQGPDERGGAAPEGEAAFVLHSVALGPIEVRLRLGGGALAVGVVVDPSAEADARAAAPELASALARAVISATPVVEVAARTAPPPPAPRVEESLDVRG